MRHVYDKNKALVGAGYAVSSDSFDIERYRELQDLDDYGSNMPSKLAHYMFDEDTFSDSRNGI
jgi:hypothetical protein